MTIGLAVLCTILLLLLLIQRFRRRAAIDRATSDHRIALSFIAEEHASMPHEFAAIFLAGNHVAMQHQFPEFLPYFNLCHAEQKMEPRQ